MKIDELMQELEEVREEHGNLEVGINYETFAFKDISKVKTKEEDGDFKAWVVQEIH